MSPRMILVKMVSPMSSHPTQSRVKSSESRVTLNCPTLDSRLSTLDSRLSTLTRQMAEDVVAPGRGQPGPPRRLVGGEVLHHLLDRDDGEDGDAELFLELDERRLPGAAALLAVHGHDHPA